MQEFLRRCARHASWVLEVEEVKVNLILECEHHRNISHLACHSLLSISVRHEVGLLWLSTIAAITLSNTWVPDVCAVVVVEWCVVRSDTSWNVCGVGLWLISSRVLRVVVQRPIIESRSSSGGTQIFWSVDAGIWC